MFLFENFTVVCVFQLLLVCRFRERQKVKDAAQKERLADLEIAVLALADERAELDEQRADLNRQSQLLETAKRIHRDGHQEQAISPAVDLPPVRLPAGQLSDLASQAMGPPVSLPQAMPQLPPHPGLSTSSAGQSAAAAAFSLPSAAFSTIHATFTGWQGNGKAAGLPLTTTQPLAVPEALVHGGMAGPGSGTTEGMHARPMPHGQGSNGFLATPGRPLSALPMHATTQATAKAQLPATVQPLAHGRGGSAGAASAMAVPSSLQATRNGSGTGSDGFEVTMYGPKSDQCMGWTEFCVFYKDRIVSMAQLLPAARADASSNEAVICNDLLCDLLTQIHAIFHKNPAVRDRVHMQPMLTSHDPMLSRKPDRALWQGVVGGLQLSRSQQLHAVQLHRYFLQHMESIMSYRRNLGKALLATCGEAITGEERHPLLQFRSYQELANKHSRALQTTLELKQNLSEETAALIEAGHGLLSRVLSPLQACSVLVGVFPWFPDKVAMMDCIVESEYLGSTMPPGISMGPAGNPITSSMSKCHSSTAWHHALPPL